MRVLLIRIINNPMECLFQPKFKGKPITSFEQVYKSKVSELNSDMKVYSALAKRASDVILERKLGSERLKREVDVLKMGIAELFKQIRHLMANCEAEVFNLCKGTSEHSVLQHESQMSTVSELAHILMTPVDANTMDYEAFAVRVQEKKATSQKLEKLLTLEASPNAKFDSTQIGKQLHQLSRSIQALVTEFSPKPSLETSGIPVSKLALHGSPRAAAGHSHSKSVLPAGSGPAAAPKPTPTARGETTPAPGHKHTPSKCLTPRSKSPIMLKTDICRVLTHPVADKRREMKMNKMKTTRDNSVRDNRDKENKEKLLKENTSAKDALTDATNRDGAARMNPNTPQKVSANKMRQVLSPPNAAEFGATKTTDLFIPELSAQDIKKRGMESASLPHIAQRKPDGKSLRINGLDELDQRNTRDWKGKESFGGDKYHLVHLESQRLSLLTESNQEQSAAFNNTLTSGQKLSNFAHVPSLEQQLAQAPTVSEPRLYDLPLEAKLTSSIFDSQLYQSSLKDTNPVQRGTRAEGDNTNSSGQTLGNLLGKARNGTSSNKPSEGHQVQVAPATTPATQKVTTNQTLSDDAVNPVAQVSLAKFNEGIRETKSEPICKID